MDMEKESRFSITAAQVFHEAKHHTLINCSLTARYTGIPLPGWLVSTLGNEAGRCRNSQAGQCYPTNSHISLDKVCWIILVQPLTNCFGEEPQKIPCWQNNQQGS